LCSSASRSSPPDVGNVCHFSPPVFISFPLLFPRVLCSFLKSRLGKLRVLPIRICLSNLIYPSSTRALERALRSHPSFFFQFFSPLEFLGVVIFYRTGCPFLRAFFPPLLRAALSCVCLSFQLSSHRRTVAVLIPSSPSHSDFLIPPEIERRLTFHGAFVR